MKTKNTFQFWMAFLCIESLLLSPLSIPKASAFSLSDKTDAEELVDLCTDALSANPTASGINLGGSCAKAKVAVQAESLENTLLIVYGTAMVSTTAMAFTPGITVMMGKVCEGIAAAAAGFGFVDTMVVHSATTKYIGEFDSLASDAMSAMTVAGVLSTSSNGLMGMLGTPFQSLTNVVTSTAEQTESTLISTPGSVTASDPIGTLTLKPASGLSPAQQAAKGQCITSAIMMGIQTGITLVGKNAATSAAKSALQAVKSIGPSTGNTNITLTDAPPAAPNNKVVAPNNNVAGGTGATICTTLQCMSAISPEVSALTSSPGIAGGIQSATGQDLGSLVAAGNSPSSASNPVAGALGASGDAANAISKLASAGEQLAQDAGALANYHPVAYVASGSKSSAAGGFDFGKIMSDTLRSLNPDAANDKGKDASELVFRQLDLLPANKIEANKDISLFARIGYRYRKTSDKVETLNWANPQNQTATASASATTTSTAATTTATTTAIRAPASASSSQ